MRSEREIREKIDSLNDAFKMVKSAKIASCEKQTLKEDICGQIDMLLWVLEDKSGFNPLDERIGEILTNILRKYDDSKKAKGGQYGNIKRTCT